MTLAVYPGSFDPFTLGHRDILLRSLKIFDEIVIAVGVNQNKKTLFSPQERVKMIENEVLDQAGVMNVANLPTLDEARANIVGILNASASKLVSILLARSEKMSSLPSENSETKPKE